MFLNLIRTSKRGKLKIYLGMAAGVGKTYRMLLEAKDLLENNVDVVIGYIEAHGRVETEKLMTGLPFVERKIIFYKGRQFEELDTDSIILQKPEVVLVDELAHTNASGSKNEKRWQDVNDLLEAGVNVISTVNIQHIESLYDEVEKITGIKVTERVPDSIIQSADEVVNVDLSIDELIDRLREGKIYGKDKIPFALNNFFQGEKLLQLRDLALKEVSRQVSRKIIREIHPEVREKLRSLVTAISSNDEKAKKLIRKSSRLAALYNSQWYVVYIQTDNESADRIDTKKQRLLLYNFKLAADLGADVVKIKSNNIAGSLIDFAKRKEAAIVVIGKPEFSLWRSILGKDIFRKLAVEASNENLDLFMVSSHENNKK